MDHPVLPEPVSSIPSPRHSRLRFGLGRADPHPHLLASLLRLANAHCQVVARTAWRVAHRLRPRLRDCLPPNHRILDRQYHCWSRIRVSKRMANCGSGMYARQSLRLPGQSHRPEQVCRQDGGQGSPLRCPGTSLAPRRPLVPDWYSILPIAI
jgi:hypothetical protein